MLPCCAAVIPSPIDSRDRTKLLWNKTNCVDLFGLKEELLNCGYFREIEGVGWSMFPTIRNGDLLKTTPCKIKDLEIADVLVYRIGDKLCAHRIIDKKVINGRSYLLTRGDTSGGPGGETVDEKDLLAKITQIKRGGKILSTEKKKATAWDKFLYKKTMAFLKLTTLFKKILETALTKIQSLRLYEVLGKKLVERIKPHLNFELAVPFSTEKLNRLYNRKPLKDNKRVDISWLKESKIFHLVLKFKKTPIGYISILNRPDYCPYKGLRISELYVRLRYRRLGFHSILQEKAEVLIKEAKIDKV